MNLPLLVMMVLSSYGSGDDQYEPTPPEPKVVEEEKSGNVSEVSFGYMGQWSDERNRSLELKPTSSDPPFAGAVTDPFLGKPYDSAILAGPVLEWRGIYKQVRLTVGLRFPFSNFRPS